MRSKNYVALALVGALVVGVMGISSPSASEEERARRALVGAEQGASRLLLFRRARRADPHNANGERSQ